MSESRIDEIILKVNRIVDDLFYDIVEAYDWNDICETGVYNEDNWRVEELTGEQLKKYIAKKQKLDSLMVPTAMKICQMEDADIIEFADFAKLGKHYILRALINLNNIEKAKSLGLISENSYYKNYGITELQEKLKDVETPGDLRIINDFIRDNNLPEEAYSIVREFVKEKLLKSEDLSIKDKLACIDKIHGKSTVKDGYYSDYKYDPELLQEIVTRSDEEEIWLAKETGDDNLIIQVLLKSEEFDYYNYYDDMFMFVEALAQYGTEQDFAKVEKVMVEQMPDRYLWFIDCVVEQGASDYINWELVNNATIKYIKNLPEDFNVDNLHYVFTIEGFDREKITEAILQNDQIDITEAMESMLSISECSKSDKKLIDKLFTAKCSDEWTLYRAYAKFNPKATKKLYAKLLEYREEYQTLSQQENLTTVQQSLIKQFAEDFKMFEQEHPEVLDSGFKR